MSKRLDVLAGTGPIELSQRWTESGVPVDAGTVTYAVTDANGTAVASGTATKTGAAATTVYSFDLPIRPLPSTDKVVWTRTDTGASLTDWVEVVGSTLFTLAEARARTISGLQTPLSDTTAYPNETIAEWRLRIADQFEQRTGRSWIRRYCRVECSGTGSGVLYLGGRGRDHLGNTVGGPGRYRDIAQILAVTIGGVAGTAADVKVDGRYLYHTTGSWTTASINSPFNVVVEYTYGDLVTDLEANDHGLRMLLANAVASDISGYAQSFDTPSGSVSPGEGGWVYPAKTWEWLKQHPRRAVVG